MIFALYSCSKSKPDNPVPSGPTPTMTYYFNDSLVTIAGNGLPNYNNALEWIACFSGAYYFVTGHDTGPNSSYPAENDVLINFLHDTTIQNSIYAVSDSLQAQTYHFNAQMNSSRPPIEIVRIGPTGSVRQFEIQSASDSFTLTINRYSNGTFDGTFSGTLSGVGGISSDAGGQTGIITDGQFSNIPVVR